MLDPPPGYVSIGFLEFDYQELKGHDDWSNLVYGFRHTYNYGAYTSNSDELTWEQVKQILELREALSPIPVLTVNDTILIKNSETIFRGNGSIGKNATVTEYYFDFGDNETSGWILHNQTKHTYTTLGIYNASLSVRDNYGVESIKPAIIEITVTNEQGEIPEPTDPSKPTKPSDPTPRRG
ncbi:MAG: hypothetical protein GWN00_09055, partial [Aliifodinibius sp.]|nr:hypothetical protein [Fodinibius sp.]NIY24944.1 hypothetical protein [Fodinibius sp.]